MIQSKLCTGVYDIFFHLSHSLFFNLVILMRMLSLLGLKMSRLILVMMTRMIIVLYMILLVVATLLMKRKKKTKRERVSILRLLMASHPPMIVTKMRILAMKVCLYCSHFRFI